jgi:hypothetical protein
MLDATVRLGHSGAVRSVRPATATLLGAVLLLTAGCRPGSADDLSAPTAGQATEPPPASTTTAPATTAPATTAATATAEAVSAAAEVTSSAFGRPGTLDLTVGPVEHGRPPAGGLVLNCHLTDDSTEYVTVTVRFVDRGDSTKLGALSNFRLDLSLPAASGAGVFVSEETDPASYCGGGTAFSPQATLQTQSLSGEHQDVTAYLVARTSATHPDPLAGLTMTADHLRRHPDNINATPWTWHTTSVTAGAACPGDPDSLCVPLG